MKRTIIGITAFALCMPLFAATVDLTPGSLQSEPACVQFITDATLTLTGTATQQDMEQLQGMSRSVKTLDMSALIIEGNRLPDNALMGSAVQQVTLPASLTAIGKSAFAGSHITSIVIPATVSAIGDYAFANCTALTSVSISSPLATMGDGLFKGDTSLVSATLWSGVKTIPAYTFDGCSQLTSPQPVPSTVTTVGAYAYRGTSFAAINLENVTSAGDFAFADMPNLIEITLDTSHEISVGTGTFFADSNLAKESLSGLTLTPLLMANTLGSQNLVVDSPVVGEAAFANNTGVRQLTLGSNITEIKANAFRNMTSLHTVDVEDRDTSVIEDVADDAFAGLPETESGSYDVQLMVKKKTEALWAAHPVWQRFKIIEGSTGVVDIADAACDVKAVRNGSTIEVRASQPIEYAGVFNMAGMTLHESAPGTETTVITDLPADQVLVIKVKSGTCLKVLKLK